MAEAKILMCVYFRRNPQYFFNLLDANNYKILNTFLDKKIDFRIYILKTKPSAYSKERYNYKV